MMTMKYLHDMVTMKNLYDNDDIPAMNDDRLGKTPLLEVEVLNCNHELN